LLTVTMSVVSAVRAIVFSFVIVGTIIVFGISAFKTSQQVQFVNAHSDHDRRDDGDDDSDSDSDNRFSVNAFALLPLIVSIITLLTVPFMLVIGFIRRGAFISMVIVELVWLGILWVLWLATGALWATAFATDSLSEALEAFSWLNWLALFGYWLLLLIFSIIGLSRNHRIFTTAVSEAQFFSSNANQPQPMRGEQQMMMPQQQNMAHRQPMEQMWPQQNTQMQMPQHVPHGQLGQQPQFIPQV